MKLSENTINILRNFANINPGMQFKAGNIVRTVSKQQNVLGKATVSETFDSDFVIYDMNRFLSVVSALDNPDIVFNAETKKVQINSGTSKCVYGLSDESLIVAPPSKELKVENAEIKFQLSADNYAKVLKLAGMLALPNIAVVGDGSEIVVCTTDAKNGDSDLFSIKVGDTKAKFKIIFNTENLKMTPGTYDVQISSKGISHFKNTTSPIEYWLATEAGSKYEG